MEEHWKLNNDGSLAGVYGVNPLKGRYADMWDRIDAAIKAYTQLHPKEMAEALLDIEYTRQAQNNEWGQSQTGSMRLGAMVPPGLGRMLEIIEPDLFNNKKLFHRFLKKYPIFRITKRA